MSGSLTGRVAFVTGVSRRIGIGCAVASRLAAHEAFCQVLFLIY